MVAGRRRAEKEGSRCCYYHLPQCLLSSVSFWLLRWLHGKDWTAEVEDAELCRCLAEKKQALKDAALSSPLGRLVRRELHRRSRSTCCCCRTPRLGWAAAGNMCMFTCICIFVVLECAPTQHLPSTSLSVWPACQSERGTGAPATISALADAQVEAWLGGLLLPGSRGTCWRSQGYSVPSPSGALCGQLCLTLEGTNQAWKEAAASFSRVPPGRLAGRNRQREHLLLQRNTSAGDQCWIEEPGLLLSSALAATQP